MESTEDNKIWLFHISPSRYTYTMIFTVLQLPKQEKPSITVTPKRKQQQSLALYQSYSQCQSRA